MLCASHTNSCPRVILGLTWFMLMLVSQAASGEEFLLHDLDELVVQSQPSRKGSVEILMLPRVSVVGEVGSPPRDRKTDYLMDILERFGVDPLPDVHEEMVFRSKGGREVRVYLEASVAQHIREADIVIGDALKLSGYHVYNSRHGPGILVADYENLELTWLDWVRKWFASPPPREAP